MPGPGSRALSPRAAGGGGTAAALGVCYSGNILTLGAGLFDLGAEPVSVGGPGRGLSVSVFQVQVKV